MVTREEYNKALDVVEAYHEQLSQKLIVELKNAGKTRLAEWDKLHLCHTRIQTAFKHVTRLENQENNSCLTFKKSPLYIEDLTARDFYRFRFLGVKAWKNFISVRGY